MLAGALLLTFVQDFSHALVGELLIALGMGVGNAAVFKMVPKYVPEAVGGAAKAPVHRYKFPPQDTDLRGGEELRMLNGEKFGSVENISLDDRTIDIKKRKDTAGIHPEAAFAQIWASGLIFA